MTSGIWERSLRCFTHSLSFSCQTVTNRRAHGHSNLGSALAIGSSLPDLLLPPPSPAQMATRHGSSDSETSESYEVLQSRKEEPEEKRRRTNSADKIQDGSHRVHQRDNVQSGWMYDSQCCSNCGAVKIIWQYQAICHLCNHIAYDAPVPDPRSELKELLDNFIKEHPTLSVQDAFEIILCKMLQGKQRHPLPPERMSIMANLVGNMLQLIAGTVSSLEATRSEHGTGTGKNARMKTRVCRATWPAAAFGAETLYARCRQATSTAEIALMKVSHWMLSWQPRNWTRRQLGKTETMRLHGTSRKKATKSRHSSSIRLSHHGRCTNIKH